MWFLESGSKCNSTWGLILVSNPHLQITDKNTGVSVKVPWPLVGTSKTQHLPFLLLRWVEVGQNLLVLPTEVTSYC